MGFIGEHSGFGAAAAAAFLASDFLGLGALGGDEAPLLHFNFIEQQSAGQEAVETLLAGGLAFDLQAGRAMEQHDAGGGLVNVLAAVSARADKGFFDVGIADAQCGHALGELGLFVGADGERVHRRRVADETGSGEQFWEAVWGMFIEPRQNDRPAQGNSIVQTACPVLRVRLVCV